MPHIAQLANACWNSKISVWCVLQCGKMVHQLQLHTINSEIFARVYIRETLHIRIIREIKSSRNGEITLSLTEIGKSCHSRKF